ncbi:MAG: STAS domain-containing protein [Candidatus Omnitrophota bacterium]|nr:STAS domain-containing protein [Candidatus Omnitrophota bacterium]
MEKKDINIKIIEGKQADIKLVKLEGVLDTITVPKLDSFMSSLTHRENICVIIDCTALTYINSTGLATLILYYIQTKRRNGALKLVTRSEFVDELMSVSGARKLLDTYETIEAAIKDWELHKKSV